MSMLIPVQLMVSGVPGKNGVPAQSLVVVESKSDFEHVLIQLMVAETALEDANRHNLAICRPVQVRHQVAFTISANIKINILVTIIYLITLLSR